METILIWIVLFLLAGIFLAVKEKFSSERVTTAKNEVLDQTVEPRTEKKESKEIHGDSTENVVQRAISERQKSSRVNRSINHQITHKDQRAHQLRVEQFLEQESNSRVERDLKKAATRKARVERSLRKKEAQVERQVQEIEKRNADRERKTKLKLRSRNATRTFLAALSWNQVEHLAVDLLLYDGWYVSLTQPGVDRGIDAIATKPNEKRKAVIQVKHWKNTVGRPVVQQTIGAAEMSGISEVFVITTGRFTADARNTANEYSGQSLEKSCELWDGDDLVDLIIKMPNDDFLDMVLEGDKLKLNYKNALNEGYAAELNS